ncbi:phage tail protein [Rhizobium sp. WW_1]|uniref:phage tail protein n=1 Tax=Rhizobium sp. WW_1 TaxID=1907375 RepID=UPI000691B7C5|nr:phage tail protein [Rhizobium sp. WW_1]RKD61563.1 putative tail protein [Rhizobium sp. WW_1]
MAVFSTALVAGWLGVAETSFLASVSAFALNAAVGVGVSLLAKKLQEPKDQNQTNGVQGTLQAGGDVPRSIIFGRTCTAGSLVYANTWGKSGKVPNAYFTQVIALADFPVSQMTGLWVNGAPVTVDTNDNRYGDWGYPVKEYDTGNNNHMWIKFYDGRQTVADPFLVNTVSSSARPYQASRVGVGVAYAIVTSQVNDELFTGFPTFRFEIQGAKLYDASRDSSVGGAGPHRWNDPSTWGGDGDDLPAVQIYNVLRGMSYNGAWLYGLQSLTQARLPSADWIGQINKCRAGIAGPGGLEPTYLTSLEVNVDAEIGTTIESFLTGCQGHLNEVGGIYKLRAGAPSAPVFAFSDGDILSTEEQTYTPFPGLADLANGVSATYPEPAEAWNTKTAPPLYSPDFERQDGSRRLMTDVQLPMVYRSSQVQRIMKSALEEARRARQLTMVLEPRAGVLEPGDIVAFTSDRNGFVNKLFRVDGVGDRANLDVLLQLTEVDPSDYDWDHEHDYTPPIFGPLGPVMPPAQIMEGWTVQPATITDANGVPRRPAIKIGCAADLQDTMAVWVQVRTKATGIVVFDSSSTAYAPPYSWLLSGDWCLPAETYETRGRYLPYSRRATEWSAWIDVTTPDTRLSFVDLAADIIASLQTLQDWINGDLQGQVLENAQAILDEVQARADAIAAEQSERVAGALESSSRYRDLVREIASIRDYAADLANASYTQKEQLRQTLNARIGDVVASFSDQITVAVSANAALALRVTSLEVDTGDLQAEITQVDKARADGDQALADRMSLLSAGTDNQFDPAANALWTFDTTVQGWTGNGNPTIASGYLRPADHATDPYVISPAGLAVAGNVSRQVRARIRRTGVPAWEGIAWWKSASDSGWAVARQQVIAEPEFDLDGVGLITFNMTWSGTVDQIRIDLSPAQTATDYFEFDWIAIGSPSPGASRAELAAEQQARASGDSANAQQITALQAALNATNGTVQATSTALGTLQGSVSALGNTVTAQGQSLTALNQAVADKASIASVDQLSNKIDSMGGPDGVSSIGQSVRAIRNSLLPPSMEGVEQDFANFLDKMNGQAALSLVSQTLTSQITLTQSSLDILSQAVTQVQATLPGLATSTALTALTARVTAAEGSITLQSQAITSLQTALPGKADASALNSLTATVSQQGDTISSQGQAITSLQNSLPGKADASAVSTLQTTVNNQGGQITAISSALTQVTASAGEATADGNWRIEAVAGPSGYARFGAQARVNNGQGYRSAGWYVDVPGDPNAPSRFLVQANQFGFVDNGAVPFAVSNGITYLVNANIQYADIGTLQVGRSNIRSGAISRVDYSGLDTAGIGTSDTPITGLTVTHGTDTSAVIVHSAFSLAGTGPTGQNNIELPVKVVISIWDSANGRYTAVIEQNFMGRTHFAHEYNFTPPAGSSQTTFRFDVRVTAGSNVTANNRTIRVLTLYGR